MKKTKKKAYIILVSAVLVLGIVLGGTVAYLSSQTTAVTNTFTIGDINITLTETDTDSNGNKSYESFVPGDKLDKDPKVTVTAGSEKSYVFVKVTESNNTYTDLSGKIIDWTANTSWTKYDTASTTTETVLYQIVNEASSSTELPIIKDNKVTVNANITKAMADAVTTGIRSAKPSLKFRAAAIQFDNVTGVAAAYAAIKDGLNT